MNGILFDIQRFSVHDGPGIRTTAFLKGCGLRCAWCHNPEGLQANIQPQFFADKCLACGRCKGIHTLENIDCCPSGALKACGFTIDEETLESQLLRDQVFYGSTGGVTFSGGECLLQAGFVAAVCRRMKGHGIHTCIDTSGFVPWKSFEETMDVCDLYLYDIKAADREKHICFTGHDNALILDNLKRLDACGKEIWIRTPVIPGVNDDPDAMKAIADIVAPLQNVSQLTLMPYHTLGKSKYETLGLQCPYNTDRMIETQRLEEFKEIFRQRRVLVQ